MVLVFDLDDTLYDEIDFVKSGFWYISKYVKIEQSYEFMLEEFYKNGSGRVLNALIEEFALDVKLQKLIEIYRFAKPNIALDNQARTLLEFAKGYKTALISDGHYITQQNKFDALGLQHYIQKPIFSDFYHSAKPDKKPFELIMQHFKDEEFVYIADNPKKDFFAPKALGWRTIRFKNPVGIYKEYENNAEFEVNSRKEILEVLKRLV